MISISSTLDINGVSVTLSVRVSAEGLQQLAGDVPISFSTEESLRRLAHSVSRGLPEQLHQAHSSVSQSLCVASIELLEESMPETKPQEEVAA